MPLDIRPAAERLADVVLGDERGGGIEAHRVGRLGLHLPSGRPEPEQLPCRSHRGAFVGRERQWHLGVGRATAPGPAVGVHQVDPGLGQENAVCLLCGQPGGGGPAGGHAEPGVEVVADLDEGEPDLLCAYRLPRHLLG